MSQAIPVILCVESALKNKTPILLFSVSELRSEVQLLGTLQRTAEILNEMVYFEAILANARSARPKVWLMSALWEKTCVVRPALLKLLVQRLEICKAELTNRELRETSR
jgi:hypothetical protein